MTHKLTTHTAVKLHKAALYDPGTGPDAAIR
jgi:hypothetical protein